MLIEVWGPGCARCLQTAQTIERVLRQLGRRAGEDYHLQKIDDPRAIALRKLVTPAVVIDGQVVWQGSVPTADQVKVWLGARP